ncbi:IQ and AAA domain-containing protein 1-like [Copidosoma floridanum]|uniref:IQ and AAA domain-containing protein 1-like n=1 Tax=Copidosoma floridanum TaxID=29053 RepID=UPI0006C98E6A|nr:IQ and AAA domain-containing protein 1-like [Copidosoma floridanum]
MCAVELRRKRDEKLASEEVPAPEIDPVTKAKAATVVQKAWRNDVARREVKRKHDRLLEILGLAVPSWNPNGYLLRDGEACRKANMDAQLRAASVNDRAPQIRESHGLQVIEDVQDEIRQWFFLWFEDIGYFDSLPPQEVGGSKLIATGQTRTPAEYLAGLTADSKPKGNTKKEETSAKEEKEEEEEEKELGWSMPESKVLAHLEGAIDEFGERWAHRVDALLGSGGLLVDLVREDLHYELQLEMRGVADELAREELDKLNRGLAADIALEGLPFTPPPPQFDVLKPAKASKNQKKKKEAPVEAPLEEAEELSILLELLEDGVLRLPGSSDGEPEAKLSEWPGVVSVALGPECRLGDLKQPVLDYCVLPVGSRSVHELAPLVRSVCLCGPAGSGQDFLARAICAELKAAVFDLTPEKHVGRFLGRDGRNKLIRSVVRLAKAYAPSVVLVRGESAWLKKLPAELRPVQPKRFAPIYQKIVNSIKPGDQVLFLTTSSEPYLASAQFTKLHDKFIVVPIADRSSLYRAYKLSLMAYHGIDRNLELSALARLTSGPQGTPIERVPEIIARALPATRRIQLKRRPLRPEELLEQWLLVDRPEDAQLNGLEKFRAKLPLEGKRRKLEEAELEGQAQPAGKKKK